MKKSSGMSLQKNISYYEFIYLAFSRISEAIFTFHHLRGFATRAQQPNLPCRFVSTLLRFTHRLQRGLRKYHLWINGSIEIRGPGDVACTTSWFRMRNFHGDGPGDAGHLVRRGWCAGENFLRGQTWGTRKSWRINNLLRVRRCQVFGECKNEIKL